MDETLKLLDESNKRVRDIYDLMIENMTGDNEIIEISKFTEISEELDKMKHQVELQNAAIINCKNSLSQAEEPWNCNIMDIYKENLDKETQNKGKPKDYFLKSLKKHMKQKENLKDNESMEIVDETRTAVDPWTKQPIQQPVQSKTCQHMYDKRSIACITRNRNQFKCPYVGCQHVVTQNDLEEMDSMPRTDSSQLD